MTAFDRIQYIKKTLLFLNISRSQVMLGIFFYFPALAGNAF